MDSLLNKIFLLIETSKDSSVRIQRIKNLIRYKSDKIHVLNFLENIIVSDTDLDVRKSAFNTFKKIDPKKLIYPTIFLIQNETGIFLLELICFLAEIDPKICSKMIKWKLKKEKYDYNLNIDLLPLKKLKEIICNMIMNECQEKLYFHRRTVPLALNTYDF